jgi:ribose transport system permease protein
MSQNAISIGRSAGQAGGLIKRFIAGTGPLIVLILLAATLWFLSPPFRTPTSLMLIGLEAAALGIVSAGQTFVILTGGIDLSVEAMVSFAGVVAAILIAGTNVAGGQIAFGVPAWVAISAALAAGALIGIIQGMFINIQKDSLLSFLTEAINIGGLRIPMPLIIALVIYGICWFVLKHTKLGRYTYAIGGNETAARLSGINVDMAKVAIYGISSFLAAIGGILVMGRLQSGAYQNGTNITLVSVAGVVIGGTALSGGVGGIWGTLVGVFIIRIVEAGLVYLDVQSNAKEIVIGAIIVLAVALDVARRGEIPWLHWRTRPQQG